MEIPWLLEGRDGAPPHRSVQMASTSVHTQYMEEERRNTVLADLQSERVIYAI